MEFRDMDEVRQRRIIAAAKAAAASLCEQLSQANPEMRATYEARLATYQPVREASA